MRHLITIFRSLWQSFIGSRETEADASSPLDTNDKTGTITTEAGVSVKLRPYEPRDRRDVLQIARTAFDGVCLDENIQKEFGQVGDDWHTLKKSAVEYDLKHNPASTFIAVMDGPVVGFICTRLYHSRRLGHISNLAVRKPNQGQGIGRAMLKHALKYFADEGMEFARIETLEQNAKGKQFYPSFGFKEVGRQIFYFKEV